MHTPFSLCLSLVVLLLFSASAVAEDDVAFQQKQQETRLKLARMLGLPDARVPLDAQFRGQSQHDGIVIEKWVFTSEPGSKIPALLYRPVAADQRLPAVVLTFGHSGAKSYWADDYTSQLYARMGVAVLAMDSLGEGERDPRGRVGTRAHDLPSVHERSDRVGRLIMGKLVFDTMRGVDFLLERDDIDASRIGVVGTSLGGATASWVLAMDTRVSLGIISGWAFGDVALEGKACTSEPARRMLQICPWPQFIALFPGSVLVMNGRADNIIDRLPDKTTWQQSLGHIDDALAMHAGANSKPVIESWFEPDGGHRPYQTHKAAAQWIARQWNLPGWSTEAIASLPVIQSGTWCDRHGIVIQKFYATARHHRGASMLDMNLVPTPAAAGRCLTDEERTADDYTVQGWLKAIETRNSP